MKVLVTGGSGFLGEHVVRELLARGGNDVRVLCRSHAPMLEELGAEQVLGDVLSEADVASALKGCKGVFHLAGVVSRDPEDSQLMMRVHVDGTRTLLAAAAKAKVKRVVLASSSGTVAVTEAERVSTERDGYATEVAIKWPYYASKIYQEKAALALAETLGIELVVVNPSLLLGPGDRRLSSTKDVLRFLRRQLPVVPPGGINFVDVRDAAAATVNAMERGKPGERYLMGGPNWTFEEFFGRLARAAKMGQPRLKLPKKLSLWGADLVAGLYRSQGREAPLSRESVEMGHHFWWLDASKAARDLGFEARDPSLTLADTVGYLRRGLGE